MDKIIGYMLTWTTYGTWLQGDKRGYVKNGKILPQNNLLLQSNLKEMKYPAAKFNAEHRAVVHQAILDKAKEIRQRIYAVAVCSNHVHIVAEHINESIEKVVSFYKNAARLALRSNGFNGRIWTKGFDKRFCFNQNELEKKIKYVKGH
ncbi:MAG: transposase [Planctomycetes bacterium]|nr:transposase [Planctomycetota bacterium]